MSPDDEVLVKKAKRLFQRALPGIVERIEALPGEDLPVPKPPIVTPPDARALQMSLAYLVKARGGLRLAMRVTVEQTADAWKIVQHSYHFGSSTNTEQCYLRVCQNRLVPYHFHLQGHEKAYFRGHIPAEKADPPLSSDPGWFLDQLQTFIDTDRIAIKVKP